jgi:hypothetical protein
LFVRGGRAVSPIVVTVGQTAVAPVAELDSRLAMEKQPIIVIDNYDSFTYRPGQPAMEKQPIIVIDNYDSFTYRPGQPPGDGEATHHRHRQLRQLYLQTWTAAWRWRSNPSSS